MTASKPDTALPIDVQGDLCIDVPSGRQVRLKAEGSQLHLAVPGWAELSRLGPGSLLARRRTLAASTRALQRLSLSLHIQVDGQRVFGLGAGVKTSFIARLLGLSSADIRFSTVINLLRSRATAA